MTYQETAALETQRLKLASTNAYLELWEFRYDEPGLNGAFLTSNPEPVTFAGVTYSPFPLSRAELQTASDGSIVDLVVQAANVDLWLDGISRSLGGTKVIWRLVNEVDLTDPDSKYEEHFTIREVEPIEAIMLIHMRPTNPLERDFPSCRFSRDRCEWLKTYGVNGGNNPCGYDTTRAGALQSCDGTYGGPNGCVVHGDSEVTLGLPRRHPLHFGAEPSLFKGPVA